MNQRILRVLCLAALFLLPRSPLKSQTILEPLLRDPSRAEWSSLSRFSDTLTREAFEQRLREVFDPFHGLDAFLQITNNSVKVFAAPGREQLVEVRFAASPDKVKGPPEFRTVSEIARRSASKPLAGLRLVIEPADIGGKWGDWDDRSTFYRGYGRIEEGDLNLTVAKILERHLQLLGVKVFLTRRSAEPVASYDPQKLDEETREILARQSYTLPPAFYERARRLPPNSERRFQIAKEVLFAKVIEQRARSAEVRRHFRPDPGRWYHSRRAYDDKPCLARRRNVHDSARSSSQST